MALTTPFNILLTALLAAFSLTLSGCVGPSNTEGKMLDASSPYCETLRMEHPRDYVDVCESGSAWKQRAPNEYAHADELHDRDKGLDDVVIDAVLGLEDDRLDDDCEFSAKCQRKLRRSR